MVVPHKQAQQVSLRTFKFVQNKPPIKSSTTKRVSRTPLSNGELSVLLGTVAVGGLNDGIISKFFKSFISKWRAI